MKKLLPDIFWLKDESLKDMESLPDLDILGDAFEKFRSINEDLEKKGGTVDIENHISPESFWDQFSAKLTNDIREKKEDLNDLYSSGLKWTRFIMPIIKSIGEELGYTGNGEISQLYQIDMCFSKFPRSKNELNKYAVYDWDLEIVVEHENQYDDWLYEFTKLVHINCGLKVIVGYHRYCDDSANLSSIIDIAETLYKKRKYRSSIGNWLIIIGPFYLKKDLDFYAYKLINGKFHQLEEKRILR